MKTDGLAPMPPFIKLENGLSVDGLSLGLEVNNPILLKDNAIGLAIGKGMKLNSHGQLEIDNDAKCYIEPLQNENDQVRLNFKTPLIVSDKYLSIDCDLPICVKDNKLSLKIGDGIDLNDRGLSVMCANDSCLKIINDRLSLDLGQGLEVVGKVLKVKLAPNGGLRMNADGLQLNLSLGNALTFSNNLLNLKVVPSDMLSVSERGLSLNFSAGNGLQINQGVCSVKCASPFLRVTSDGLALSLRAGRGIDIDSEGVIKVKISQNQCLIVTDEGISLSAGYGLYIAEGKLNVKITKGFKIGSKGDLQLKISPPLAFTVDNSLTVEFGSSLIISGNKICVKAPVSPLFISSGGQIGLRIADSLRTINNQLTLPEPNAPLYLNDGRVTLNFKSTDFAVENNSLCLKEQVTPIYTVTCGDDSLNIYSLLVSTSYGPYANVGGFIKAYLSGGIVNGIIKIRSVASEWRMIKEDSRFNGIRFGIIWSPNLMNEVATNVSVWTPPVFKPSKGVTGSMFLPDKTLYTSSLTVIPQKRGFYMDPDDMTSNITTKFKPYGPKTIHFKKGEMYFTIASVTENDKTHTVLYFGFQLYQDGSGMNFFDSSTPGQTFFETPPLPFTYMARRLL